MSLLPEVQYPMEPTWGDFLSFPVPQKTEKIAGLFATGISVQADTMVFGTVHYRPPAEDYVSKGSLMYQCLFLRGDF